MLQSLLEALKEKNFLAFFSDSRGYLYSLAHDIHTHYEIITTSKLMNISIPTFFFLKIDFIHFILFYLFILAVLGLCCCAWASSSCGERGYSSLWCAGFLLWWLVLLQSTGSRCTGFSSCGTRAQQLWLAGSRAQAQQLWCTGLVALRHVGSSCTRARTCVPCIGRRILNHCTTREALSLPFNWNI